MRTLHSVCAGVGQGLQGRGKKGVPFALDATLIARFLHDPVPFSYLFILKRNLQGKLSLIRAPLHGKKRTVVHNVEFASTLPLLQGQVLICMGGVDCGVDCADWANLFERHLI